MSPFSNEKEINTLYLKYGLPQVLTCNWCRQIAVLFQYIYAWNQGGFKISNWDISLLQFMFCKNTVNLKEFLTAFSLSFCYSLNGWLQLKLQINLISFEKRDDCKCLFRRNTVPLKILGHCKRPPELMMVPLKGIRLKQKYLSNALYIGNSWLLVLF